jgi:eukaryotic-like serine/threonine-protein kinase
MKLRSSEIFERLLDLSGSELEIELLRLCDNDNDLIKEVRSLLSAHQQADQFLKHSAADSAKVAETMIHTSGIEQPGQSLGPYKLLEQIGEGGFGTVYMAQQDAPIRRRVALKIIKPGMDTKQVIVRFESERQALAVMDHPNIARVIDAGSTASGRPFFVMELVRGDPITKFCDQRRLEFRERLKLFQDVCSALEHAHQKGIIHRDIKPSNVLVTVCDDKPIVKVIDFGIAKATSGTLTDKTLFTEFRQLLGTPLYMSPEQAEQSGVDVDTRTDIYSLGVLLYEMLTGRTPIDPKRLSTAAWAEVQRMIVEEAPSKPSVLVSSFNSEVVNKSPHPVKEKVQLSALLRGELDWIVLKAIDKDRSRRYPTASQFAADIERYLNDEPVEARPPSRVYLFRKFARRHRGLLVASTAVIATLLVGIIATGYAAMIAFEQKAKAESRERQAVRTAAAAGASMLLSDAEAQRLAEGWLAEIEELKASGKTDQAVLSQAQYTVWHATWMAQHQQTQSALQLTADIYDQAKNELGLPNSTFLSLCNLRIQLLEAIGNNPSLAAVAFGDLIQGFSAAEQPDRIIPLLPQYAATLTRAGRTEEAISQLENYVASQRAHPVPPSQADIKRLRSAIDNLMNSGKVSSSLISSLKVISETGRVNASSSSSDDPELANDHKLLQGRWSCEFWKEGKLVERMRVEFSGSDNKTEWVDENGQVIRGRLGRFDLTRSGGAKVLTTYLESSAEVGGTFIYHLSNDELRIVSGMLANQPSLPGIELRVFRRVE